MLQLWPLLRMPGAGLLARLTGRAGMRDSTETWSEVWRRRAEWRDGYPSAG
jgi:hypothetical protein